MSARRNPDHGRYEYSGASSEYLTESVPTFTRCSDESCTASVERGDEEAAGWLICENCVEAFCPAHMAPDGEHCVPCALEVQADALAAQVDDGEPGRENA